MIKGKMIDYLNMTIDELNRKTSNYEKSPSFAYLFWGLDIKSIIDSNRRLREIICSTEIETNENLEANEKLENTIRKFNEAQKGLCEYLAYDEQGNPIHEIKGERK